MAPRVLQHSLPGPGAARAALSGAPALVPVLALAFALGGLGACGGGASAPPADLPAELADVRPSGGKVLLVGIDGATFNVIEPLRKAGRLPVMGALMERGTQARLRSQSPMKSPAIWTTVATGHDRGRHGIDDFMSRHRGTPQDPALIASVDRQTLALWNVLAPFELDTTVVGWWVTWPAEPIHGHLVSDRLAQSRWMSWTEAGGDMYLTFPESLAAELAPQVVDPMDPPMGEIDALIEWTDAERAELLAADEPIPFHGPSVFKFGFCEQRTYENVALELLSRGQPELGMVFLIAVDPVSHTFWHYLEPQRFPGAEKSIDPADAARLGPLIPALYEHNDRTLARLLEQVDQDTVVLIVSDHGFKASGRLPQATDRVDLGFFGIDRSEALERPVNVGMTGVHKENGVLIAAGGPIVHAAEFRTQPTVADITPTVLALMGLPVADDMSGRVLEEMIDPAFLARHPVHRIPTYEGLIERPEVGTDIDVGAENNELRESYLKALGYTD